VRSFLAVEAVYPGFQPEQILTMNISVPGATPERSNDVYSEVLERVRALPGIQAVGAIDSLFDLGKINNLGLRNIEGHTPEPTEQWTPPALGGCSWRLFSSYGSAVAARPLFQRAGRSECPVSCDYR
jgi:hypothetical protein